MTSLTEEQLLLLKRACTHKAKQDAQCYSAHFSGDLAWFIITSNSERVGAATRLVLHCQKLSFPAVYACFTWGFMVSYKYRVISRITIFITLKTGLITPLITTHEPPSTPWQVMVPLRVAADHHAGTITGHFLSASCLSRE